MSKFNKRSFTKTINLAGGLAFKESAKEELVSAVLNTFLEDKFYESGDVRIKRITRLVAQVPAIFVANLAVIARKEFNLRSVSHLLLAELSKIHRGDSLVKDAIIASAIRVDDLTEIVSYLGTPLPKQVKRGIRNAILKFDRYQLAKYKGEGKGVSLVDVFNLVHPKVKHANKEQKKAWKDLITGKLVSFDTWETEISNTKNKKKAWESLVAENKLGYMALLRNFNNLIKNDVSEKTLDLVVKKLTNEKEVKNSKQLPFRFITAYKNVVGSRKLTDAISMAMDLSVSNTPELKGKTLIAVDTSGSMAGDPIEKASIFAATLAKSSNNYDVVLYDTDLKELRISGRTPVVDIAFNIEENALGGGTNTGVVFDWAVQKNKIYDRIIIISDNESWNGNAQFSYTLYKKIADPYVYAVDIQGYGTTDISGGRVKHFNGWSNRLLDFIGAIEKESIVNYIEGYKITK